jgi:HAD superfamily hydrolase (TIGR01549 family)
MTVRAVFFDVGETLVDEARYWRALAAAAGLSPQAVWAALGKTIERREEHWELWRYLGVERPEASETLAYSTDDLYPDARACLRAVGAAGFVVGIAGNQTAALEEWAREALPVDVVTSSASLGVRKPDPRFFERLVELAGARPEEVAYVGDRADNDAGPAVEAGLVAFHLRRGPWGRLQETPDGAIAIDSLAELPVLLSRALVAET